MQNPFLGGACPKKAAAGDLDRGYVDPDEVYGMLIWGITVIG